MTSRKWEYLYDEGAVKRLEETGLGPDFVAGHIALMRDLIINLEGVVLHLLPEGKAGVRQLRAINNALVFSWVVVEGHPLLDDEGRLAIEPCCRRADEIGNALCSRLLQAEDKPLRATEQEIGELIAYLDKIFELALSADIEIPGYLFKAVLLTTKLRDWVKKENGQDPSMLYSLFFEGEIRRIMKEPVGDFFDDVVRGAANGSDRTPEMRWLFELILASQSALNLGGFSARDLNALKQLIRFSFIVALAVPDLTREIRLELVEVCRLADEAHRAICSREKTLLGNDACHPATEEDAEAIMELSVHLVGHIQVATENDIDFLAKVYRVFFWLMGGAGRKHGKLTGRMIVEISEEKLKGLMEMPLNKLEAELGYEAADLSVAGLVMN